MNRKFNNLYRKLCELSLQTSNAWTQTFWKSFKFFFFASSCTLLISNWRCFLKVFFEVRKSCTRIQKDTYQILAMWWKIKMSLRFLFDVYHRFLKARCVFEEVNSFSRNIKDDGQIIPLTSSSLSFVKAFQPWCFDASEYLFWYRHHCLLVLSSL